jgi:hypothetical protein
VEQDRDDNLLKYERLIASVAGPIRPPDRKGSPCGSGQRSEYDSFGQYVRAIVQSETDPETERLAEMDRYHADRNRIDAISWPTEGLAAAAASSWIEIAFAGLTLATHAARLGDAATIEWVENKVLNPLLSAQQKQGSFLKATSADHPELVWYNELVLLHAVADFSVLFPNNGRLAAAVFRAGEYHLNETQIDHATLDPWGLFAFIWNPTTRLVADQMLHQVSLRPAPRSEIALMLLADALYCLRYLRGTL